VVVVLVVVVVVVVVVVMVVVVVVTVVTGLRGLSVPYEKPLLKPVLTYFSSCCLHTCRAPQRASCETLQMGVCYQETHG
jgi:hypothetical protein